MSSTASSRLILLMSASLDGFLARGPGNLDWLAEPGEVAEAAGVAVDRTPTCLPARRSP